MSVVSNIPAGVDAAGGELRFSEPGGHYMSINATRICPVCETRYKGAFANEDDMRVCRLCPAIGGDAYGLRAAVIELRQALREVERRTDADTRLLVAALDAFDLQAFAIGSREDYMHALTQAGTLALSEAAVLAGRG